MVFAFWQYARLELSCLLFPPFALSEMYCPSGRGGDQTPVVNLMPIGIPLRVPSGWGGDQTPGVNLMPIGHPLAGALARYMRCLHYILGLLHSATALRCAAALRIGRLSSIPPKIFPRLIRLSRLCAGKKLSIYGNAVFIPIVRGR